VHVRNCDSNGFHAGTEITGKPTNNVRKTKREPLRKPGNQEKENELAAMSPFRSWFHGFLGDFLRDIAAKITPSYPFPFPFPKGYP